MKLTQVITNWFHKMFAWWPWRQSTQLEYAPHSSSLNKGTTQESKSKSVHESATPQTGNTPRLSTMQEWPERIVQTDVPAKDSFPETHTSGLLENGEPIEKPTASASGNATDMQVSPSMQQRLEFLQYLVKRGIVNEGFDDDR
jgi:hypothetical protein